LPGLPGAAIRSFDSTLLPFIRLSVVRRKANCFHVPGYIPDHHSARLHLRIVLSSRCNPLNYWEFWLSLILFLLARKFAHFYLADMLSLRSPARLCRLLALLSCAGISGQWAYASPPNQANLKNQAPSVGQAQNQLAPRQPLHALTGHSASKIQVGLSQPGPPNIFI